MSAAGKTKEHPPQTCPVCLGGDAGFCQSANEIHRQIKDNNPRSVHRQYVIAKENLDKCVFQPDIDEAIVDAEQFLNT